MRLFVALQIPSAVRDNLDALIKELRALEPASSTKKMRWVRPENLHVTLKFIGETDSRKTGRPLARHCPPFTPHSRWNCASAGLGFFPNEKRPRVLFAGIEAPPNFAGDRWRRRPESRKAWVSTRKPAVHPASDSGAPRSAGHRAGASRRRSGRSGARVRRVAHRRISPHRKQAETFRCGVHYAAILSVCSGGLAAHASNLTQPSVDSGGGVSARVHSLRICALEVVWRG